MPRDHALPNTYHVCVSDPESPDTQAKTVVASHPPSVRSVVMLGALVLCSLVTACRPDIITQSASKERQLSESGVSIKPIIDQANCGVAIKTRNAVRVGVLERKGLELPLPSLQSFDRGSVTRTGLHFQKYTIRTTTDGHASEVTLACLVPYDATYEKQFDHVIREYGSKLPWTLLATKLAAVENIQAPPIFMAISAMEKYLLAKAGRTIAMNPPPGARIESVLGAGKLLPVSASLSLSSTEWVPASASHDPQVLPGITVTAYPDAWVFNNFWVWDFGGRLVFFNDYVNVTYNTSASCPPASDFYGAMDAEYAKLTTASQQQNDLTNALDVAELTCKKNGDLALCVDFFIMADRSFVFEGDARPFNSEAPYSASRVQLYINPSNCEWTTHYNSTRVYGTSTVKDSSDSVWDPSRDVTCARGADGTISITGRFYNNFCKWRSVACPVIDAFIQLRPNSNMPGGYDAYFKRDGFPSMGLYNFDNATGTFKKIHEDPERIRSHTLNFTALIGSWKQTVKLPVGCERL